MAEQEPILRQWPTLETQLTEVIPGSALEQLIKDNQDFSILDPSEVNDRYAFPPWMRVWWRKSHPELNFSNPVYPIILKEILSWLRRHQDLQPTPADQPKAGAQQARKTRGV
jgi:hypothetical protein